MDVWSVSLTYNGYARKSRATHVPISWPRDLFFITFNDQDKTNLILHIKALKNPIKINDPF